jgi:5-formyltetrahydrofolate cyclo-ligase
MNIETDKKTIREKAKLIRKNCALGEDAASQFKQNVLRVLEAHKVANGIVAGYEKMHSEIDPAVLDIEYVLPQVIEGEKVLDFEGTAPDIFLVPLLAFDEKGNRMGYGGGYYDASLAFYKRLKQSVAIGIAYEEQLWSSPLPIEPHDVPLDYIVTPAAIRKF